jgi:osmotically-inducible protein OsmY
MFGFLIAAIGGAGLMYFLDPQQGNRRRALLRDQLTRFMNQTQDQMADTRQDLGNRAHGVVADARYRTSNEPVDDMTLAARVRSEMGRVVSHPGAVNVMAIKGRITLHGQILRNEVDKLLSTVKSVPGVIEVDNQLDVYDQPNNIPNLQGGLQRPGQS